MGRKMEQPVRKLQPIEIAEGALMADLAVIFQLMAIYIPIVGDFFRMPIFVVFAILVLRRSLYVGIMTMCVAWFILGVIIGPQYLIAPSLEMMGGLFLGITMKYRWRHSLALVSGVSCGAFAIYCLILLFTIVSGTPVETFVHSLQQLYNGLIFVANTLAARVGIGHWWQQQIYPVITALATWALTYWWLSFYCVLWTACWLMVLPIYSVTSFLIRLLGYDVRPFPDGKVGWWLERGRRRIVKRAIRRRLVAARKADKKEEQQEEQKVEV
jgi:hypothetical protein